MSLKEIEQKLSSFLEGKSWTDCDCNKTNIPVTWLDPTTENAEVFNRAYLLVKDWKDCPLTKSGGISKSNYNFRYYSKALTITRTSYELIIIGSEKCFCIRFRHDYGKGQEGKMSGKAAFKQFYNRCKRRGFSLNDLAIENGKEIKETIPKADKALLSIFKDRIIYDAFHVDINSAYMAGIKKAYGDAGNGVLGEVIQDIFDHRKDNNNAAKYNKAILNCTQGFMQSQYCVLNGKGYALAHLSKAGIEFCYNELQKIKQIYESVDCKVIATNTDGIWFTNPYGYTKEQLAKAPGFGTGLGQFKIDHYNCKLRYKSAGAYEFIEDGQYNVKLSGLTRLDKVMPREQWKWGDIYRLDCEPIRFTFDEKEGIIEL